MTLTPEIQALYFQCLAGKLHNLSQDDQRLIILVFNQQFPPLRREAKRFTTPRRSSFLQTLMHWVLYFVLIVLGILIVLVALEHYAGANETQTMTLAQISTLAPIQSAEPQDTRIQTTVEGIDHIQTKAILSGNLAAEQLETVKKIVTNGTSIAEKRLELERIKINSEKNLELLRIAQSFILWGFVASIPFIVTLYWILKNILRAYHMLQKEELEYKLKELESAERQIALTEKHYSSSQKSSGN